MMKKILWSALCFCIALFIGFSPMEVSAQELVLEEMEEWDLIEWVSQTGGRSLTERQEISLYTAGETPDYAGAEAAILRALENWETWIDISEYNIPVEDVGSLYWGVGNKYPHIFYLGNSISYYCSGNYISSIMARYDDEYSKEDVEIYEKRVEEIMATIPKGMSDENAALALHDYLVSHCQYDEDYQNYDSYTALVLGDSVCNGYALAYVDLLNRYGLENGFVVSSDLNHAWNSVKIEDEWYYVDCTWDDPLGAGESYVGHTNFLRSEMGMVETGHYTNDWEPYYNCNDTRYDDYYWSSVTCAVLFADANTWLCCKNGDLYKYCDGTYTQLTEHYNYGWGGFPAIMHDRVVYYSSECVSYWDGGNIRSSGTVYAYNLNTGLEVVHYAYRDEEGILEELVVEDGMLCIGFDCTTGIKRKYIELFNPRELLITSQPQSKEVAESEYVTFAVEAEGDGLSYQWQFSKDGVSWYDSGMEGATTASLKVQAFASRNGYRYRCVIKDTYRNQLISEVAKLTVQRFVIISQPESQSVDANEYVTFAVKAEGSDLSYQWQFSRDGVGWYNSGMEGATTANMKVQALASRDGYQYRCVVTDGNGKEIVSDVASLTILDVFAITGQPISQSVSANEYVTFTVEADGRELSYQWQCRREGTNWFNSSMEGATTDSMKVKALTSRNGYQYRCIVTDGSGKHLTSDAASLTVLNSFVITGQPASQSADANEYVTFTVMAEGVDLSYQWQFCRDGENWYDSGMEGATTTSMKVQALTSRNGYQYRCVVTNGSGKELVSEEASLTVLSVFAITGQPVSQSVSVNEYVTFTVEAEGSGLSYQWQCRREGTDWFNSSMEGSTTANMKVQALSSRNGYQYRCVITNESGKELVSDGAVLNVNAWFISVQPVSQNVALNEYATFTITASGSGLSYQWQCCKDGTYWFNSSMEGCTTANLRVQALASRNGYLYRCVVTTESGKQMISNAATLSVK